VAPNSRLERSGYAGRSAWALAGSAMYEFVGLFSTSGMPFRSAASAMWPSAAVVPLSRPFEGSGLRFSDQRIAALGEDSPPDPKLLDRIIEISRQCSSDPIVYVEAECWGGDCGYSGRVFRDGRLVCAEGGPGALSRLLSHLGAQLDDREYFEPFERNFPWTG